MHLRIDQREQEGVVILVLDGPLVLGRPLTVFRWKLRFLCKAGKIRVVLNLAEVSKIDCAGLGALVSATVKLRRAGGVLTLYDLRPSHLDLLLLTRLVTVVPVFQNEQDAVNGCFPERANTHYDILDFVKQQGAAPHASAGRERVPSPQLPLATDPL